MNGTVTRIRRRDVGAIRRKSYYQGKSEACGTEKERTHVAWDALRARIKRLPEQDRDVMWRAVTEYLNGLAPDLGLPRIQEEAS